MIDQPCLVVYGTAIPTHYYEALSERMLTNGFFARMLIVESGPRSAGQRGLETRADVRVRSTAENGPTCDERPVDPPDLVRLQTPNRPRCRWVPSVVAQPMLTGLFGNACQENDFVVDHECPWIEYADDFEIVLQRFQVLGTQKAFRDSFDHSRYLSTCMGLLSLRWRAIARAVLVFRLVSDSEALGRQFPLHVRS